MEVALIRLQSPAGGHLSLLFNGMTADNGLEFATLSQAVAEQIAVYCAHPYDSWERGTSESQHGFIRLFLPKETSMKDKTEADCLRIQQWMNNYPRKILGFETPIKFLSAVYIKQDNLKHLFRFDNEPPSAWFLC